MPWTRRHFLSIAAAWGVSASTPSSGALVPVSWSGQLMGATASLSLYTPDPDLGRSLITQCLSEIDRLENLFSLFRPDSLISQLNRTGWVDTAEPDFLRVLTESERISRLSNGAFDVTVQPLWVLYSKHFDRWGRDAEGPGADAINQALGSVNWRAVQTSGGRVSFTAPNMGITLNSIARGYATDRVTAILKAAGLEHVLVDLDNYYALGNHPDGRPWRIGMADPKSPDHVMKVLDVKNLAVASASGFGTVFDRAGIYHHIFDPHTGGCSSTWAGCTVLAESATIADALSTTLLVAPPAKIPQILAEGGGVKAYMVDRTGRVSVV